ncbi:transposase [Haloferula helveola]|uniref:Transposase n=1 Tax=Haloferula helveola TaxID=490095 RepID=A0ABM7R8X3_9BACT|nr:transposase [Haloferula helveola]
MEHKGIYNRGYLPHRDVPGSLQGITFRLADSVPKPLITKWKTELSELLDSPDQRIASGAAERLRKLIARHEDSGYGACVLAKASVSKIVQDTLIAGDGERYDLLEWCIMPNHVHVLIRIQSEHPLSAIVQQWKGGSSMKINRTLGRTGTLWEKDYFDRAIRDEKHFFQARSYIRNNPVKAGLCSEPKAWPCSSAGIDWPRVRGL